MHLPTCMDFSNCCCAHFSACIVFFCLRLTNYGSSYLVSHGDVVHDAVLEDVVVGGMGTTASFWSFAGLATQPRIGESTGVGHPDCWSINSATLFQIGDSGAGTMAIFGCRFASSEF
ncbi:unnamed protein product [Dovyalis caffra]|uniref:Secreted protein n=1 Tax=Dovyalis caffra TaxID=77055 RepID=A0AAV1SCQ7_9ROSI|nr:unnamed protein product [Dovyalis caffra]